MSEKKNIDRLFQEKLKNFEATPNDAVWENIQANLNNKKRKRRVIPIWWKVAGVAALLVLLFTVGNSILSDSGTTNTPSEIVDTETPNGASNNEDSNKDNSNFENNNNTSISNTTEVANENTSTFEEDKNKTSKGISDNSSNSTSKVASSNTTKDINYKTQENQKHFSKNQNNPTTNPNKATTVAQNDTKSSNSNQKPESHLKNKEDLDNLIKGAKDSETTVAQSSTKDNNSDTAEDNDPKTNAIDEENENTEDKTIEDAIAEANNTNEEEKEESKLSRWNISPNVAPVYFNSLGKGSAIDEQFVDNSKTGEISMSYGINGSYAFNDKLKVRVGVNKVDLGYGTNNVIAYQNIDSMSARLSNVKLNNSASNNTLISAQSLNNVHSPELIKAQANSSIDQQFGFIEVPIELEYTLLNKKVGINVIGGFSTLFVNKNEIYAVNENGRTLIGEATNIKDMSYSANFGLGMNYNLSEKVKINLEPMFKYQINTFSNSSGDFQPYFIGVYTGLSYKF